MWRGNGECVFDLVCCEGAGRGIGSVVVMVVAEGGTDGCCACGSGVGEARGRDLMRSGCWHG